MILNFRRIYNLVFISIFFMYFKVLPISAETQPIGVLIGTFLMIILYVSRKISLTRKDIMEDICIYMMIVIIIVYALIQIGIETLDFTVFIRILFGPMTYVLLLKNTQYLDQKSVKFIVILLLIIFIIQIFKIPIFYTLLQNIYANFFIRSTIGNDNLSLRGSSILVSEPSYFAYFSMLILYSIDYLKMKEKFTGREWIYKFIIIIISLYSKSALVYLFLIIYFSQFLKLKFMKYILMGSLLLLLTFLFVPSLSNNRFYELLTNMTSVDKSLVYALFYADASGGYRFLINYIHLFSILINPFGFGIGGLRFKWAQIGNLLGVNVYQNTHFRYYVSSTTGLDAQAYMPNIISSVGVFSLLLIYQLFFDYNFRELVKNKSMFNIYITMLTYMMFIQTGLLNPVFWIMLGMLRKYKIVKTI